MKRLALMALALPLALATPGVAQTRADMIPQTKPYGPPQEPEDKARPQLPRDRHAIGDVAAPAAADNRHRLIAGGEIGPGAVLGLGLFEIVREPNRPDTINREPVVRSRIPAFGLSMGF